MFKFSHTALIYISGIIWMFVGWMLLRLGLTLLLGPSLAQSVASDEIALSHPILAAISPYLGVNGGVALLLILAFFVGYMKGRHVLGKSVNKGVERIRSFPNPTSLANIYSAKYYVLLGGMMALGISIKYLGIPNDIRGTIDIAIGMALVQGASSYFRQARMLKTQAL